MRQLLARPDNLDGEMLIMEFGEPTFALRASAWQILIGTCQSKFGADGET